MIKGIKKINIENDGHNLNINDINDGHILTKKRGIHIPKEYENIF